MVHSHLGSTHKITGNWNHTAKYISLLLCEHIILTEVPLYLWDIALVHGAATTACLNALAQSPHHEPISMHLKLTWAAIRLGPTGRSYGTPTNHELSLYIRNVHCNTWTVSLPGNSTELAACAGFIKLPYRNSFWAKIGEHDSAKDILLLWEVLQQWCRYIMLSSVN